MARRIVKRFLHNMYAVCIESFVVRKESRRSIVYNPLDGMHMQQSKEDRKDDLEQKAKSCPQVSKIEVEKKVPNGSGTIKYGLLDKDLNDSKWRVEFAWLTKVLEPALQFCRWALPTGHEVGNKKSSSPSFTEIIASIQRSKIGIQDWSLSDLTIGLYLIYLRQASTNPFEAIEGVQISSDAIVQDLIYHMELAKGSYKDTASSLARNSMLRESNVLKFVKNSSVMRPGYYVGVDTRTKLVIFGIRGTHTVYDLITDIVSSSDREVTFEGYSTHFGTAEAARWFLNNELGTIRKCLEKYEGFRLRLVGHSLGGAIASLLAIMLRKKSRKELGFDPDIISAIGYATPPCVSRELAESCSDFVTTVVMQDDIIPRLSVASLTRLRNEILQTDWRSVVEKGDWKSVIDLVTNAKQVISSVHGVAQKLVDYAKFADKKNLSDDSIRQELKATPLLVSPAKADVCLVPEELFVPGTVYYLKRNVDSAQEYFTLWRRHPNEHFERIVLSSNLISDHRCDSHYYALRDVLKGIPGSSNEGSTSNDSSSKTLSTPSTRRKKDG